MESVHNFRSLGGQTTVDGRRVRHDVLYRSAHLATASDADLQAMASLGISTVYDFRNDDDIEMEGADRLPEGAVLVRLPMFDPAGQGLRAEFRSKSHEELQEMYGDGRAFERMQQASGRIVSDPMRAELFGQFVRGLLEPGATPALFHCSAGKDRTGWAASLLLLALGVDEQEVIDHYLETNQHVRIPSGRPDVLTPFSYVDEAYYAEQQRVLHEAWDHFDRYWSDGLGLGPEHIEGLRSLLLGEG